MYVQSSKELTDQLHEFAAEISTFKPVLDDLVDNAGLDLLIINQLAMVSALSDHLNQGLCRLADQMRQFTITAPQCNAGQGNPA